MSTGEKKKDVSILDVKEANQSNIVKDSNPPSIIKDLRSNQSTIIKERKSSLFDSEEGLPLFRDLIGFCIMGLLSNGITSCIIAMAKILAHNFRDGRILKCMNNGVIVTLSLFFISFSLPLSLSKIFCTDMPPFFLARLFASHIYEILGVNLLFSYNPYFICTGIGCIAFSYAIQESLYLQYGQYFIGYESEGFAIASDVSPALFVVLITFIYGSSITIEYFYIFLAIKVSFQYITHIYIIKHTLKINQFRMDSWKSKKNARTHRNKLGRYINHNYQWPPFTLKEKLEIYQTKWKILIPAFLIFLMGHLGMIYNSQMFKYDPVDEIDDFMLFISIYFCGLAIGRLLGLFEHYLKLSMRILWCIAVINGTVLIIGFVFFKQMNFKILSCIFFFLGFLSGITFNVAYNALIIHKSLSRPLQKSGELIILSEMYTIAQLLAAIIILIVEHAIDFQQCKFKKNEMCSKYTEQKKNNEGNDLFW